MSARYGTVAERFERFTIPEPNSGCLLWLGAPTGLFGHPQMRVNGKSRMASHIALELAGKPLPEGMFACHKCDNPSCVNADHLFFGTQKDNVGDALAKGRHDLTGLRLGPGHNRASEEDREYARSLFVRGYGVSAASRETGRSLSAISTWFQEWGYLPRTKRRIA